MSGATHYQLFEQTDAGSTFTQIGANITATSASHEIALHRRLNAVYRVSACSAVGCTASSDMTLAANLVPAIGYFKASNAETNDQLSAVALSADGNTLAVGAPGEDSNATGINGDQTNNAALSAGAVYVFTRSAGIWSQQAYVKASNSDASDLFGVTVALSADGNTLAVGATGESSNATGVNGNQANNSASVSGAVYVFTRAAGVWSQQAYVKASNTEVLDSFGVALAISADGNTLAVGATLEDSNATGINGNQADNSANESGAVYVFTRANGAWAQQAYVKASNTEAGDSFGFRLALSGDGNTLAVGAFSEDSSANGINGDQANNGASGAGAVYVFARAAGVWSQQAYVKASNTETVFFETADAFGISVALSDDGNTLAVGASFEDSNATGVNGTQTDNSARQSGAVYVFTRVAGIWSQQAYIKASNTEPNDGFGSSVVLSGDGATLAVTASPGMTGGEPSSATGIGGNQADNSTANAGAVYIFVRVANSWSQQAYVKASNTEANDVFGSSLALNRDGSTLAVAAFLEDSNATGIGGNQSNNQATDSGAVYLY